MVATSYVTAPEAIDWKKHLLDMVAETQAVLRLHLRGVSEQRPIGDGAYTKFSSEAFTQALSGKSEKACGLAAHLFAMDATSVTMDYPINSKEVAQYARDHYWPFRRSTPLDIGAPFDVVTTSKDSPGELGTWRRVSGDIRFFSLFWILRHTQWSLLLGGNSLKFGIF